MSNYTLFSFITDDVREDVNVIDCLSLLWEPYLAPSLGGCGGRISKSSNIILSAPLVQFFQLVCLANMKTVRY